MSAPDPIRAALARAPAEGATVASLAAEAGRTRVGTFAEVFRLLRAGAVEQVGGRGTAERYRLVEGGGG
jgi:hypothetical protein